MNQPRLSLIKRKCSMVNGRRAVRVEQKSSMWKVVTILALVLNSAFYLAVPGYAQITTRHTGDIPLDGSKGSKIPKPGFIVPGVVVDKTLSVNKATGDVTQKCKFTNSGAGRSTFCSVTWWP